MTLSMVVCKKCNAFLGRVHGHERFAVVTHHIKKEHPEVADRIAELQEAITKATDEIHDITGEGSDIRYFFQHYRKEAPSAKDPLSSGDTGSQDG